MADRSYSELLTARVELNLSDFREKLKAADAAVDSVGKDWEREGSRVGFSKAGDQLIVAGMEAMQKFADDVMSDSLDEVPVDTGVLHDSWGITPPFKEGKRIIVEMGYGYGDEINSKTRRVAAQYAIPVHEILDADHQPPRKAKYLEDPLVSRGFTYGQQLAIYMKAISLLVKTGSQSVELLPSYGVVTPYPLIGGGQTVRGLHGRFEAPPGLKKDR
jgi:hypothetical protein